MGTNWAAERNRNKLLEIKGKIAIVMDKWQHEIDNRDEQDGWSCCYGTCLADLKRAIAIKRRII